MLRLSVPFCVLLACLACNNDYEVGIKDAVPGGLENGTGDDDDDDDDDDDKTGDDPNDETIDFDETCDVGKVNGFPGTKDASCFTTVATGSFTPVVEWTKSSWSTDTDSTQIMSTPIVAELSDDNGDGLINENDTPDVIVVTYGYVLSYSNGGILRAVSGDGFTELWNVSAGVQGTGGAAAADIDGDGIVEILAATPTSVKAYEHDGTFKWESEYIGANINGTSDVPAVSDMDGDGNPEIIIGSAILTNTGKIRGLGSYGKGGVAGNVGTASFAVDLDGDDLQEVITGNAVYNADGTLKFGDSSLADGYPAVGNFDNDDYPEIVVSTYGMLRLHDNDGTKLWEVSMPGGGGGAPTVADFDGDGQAEIGLAGSGTYSVFEGDGTLKWSRTTQDFSSGNTGSAVFDFEGDGVAEAVYADETKLWIFSGPDGSVKLESTEHSNGTWLEYPAIADVDGDGHAEIIVPNTGTYSGFTVFGDQADSWRPARKVWNQHAYHITNIEGVAEIPNYAEKNWLTYNSFRSADLSSGDGLASPDLRIDDAGLCELDCDEGKLVLYVHPGNEGLGDASAGAVIKVASIIGSTVTVLDTAVVPNTLPAGYYADAIQFELKGDPTEWDAIGIQIDSTEPECNDNNNTIQIDGPFCQN